MRAGLGRGRSRVGIAGSALLHAGGLGAVLILPVLAPSALPEAARSVIPFEVPPVLALAPRPPDLPAKFALHQVPSARGRPSAETAAPTPTPPDEAHTLLDGDKSPPSPESDGGCLGCTFKGGGPGPDTDAPGGGGSGIADDRPIPVGGRMESPRKIRHVDPIYPELAKAARVEGVVVLECVIAADGRVKDIRILRGNPLLEGAAVVAVREWLYRPPRLNDHPVAVLMTVKVEFRLPH